MKISEIWYFGLCWNLRLVIEFYNILKDFGFFLEDFLKISYIFALWNIWVSIILLLP